jgi:hypothetical protein
LSIVPRNPGAADFGDPVHRGGGGGDPAQRRRPASRPGSRRGYSSAMKAVVILPETKARMVHHRRTERQVVADALDLERVQRQAHFLDRLGAVGPQVQSLAIIGS